MQFHLNYKHPIQKNLIDYRHQLFLIGSCFAENIGSKLLSAKLNCCVNPNGILFNPISIANALNTYIHNSPINETDIVYSDSLYHSLNHHGCFSCADKNELIGKITENTQAAHEQLKNCDYLIITFGTSSVYSYNQSGQVVANCHKLPQSQFTKEQLQPGEIINYFHQIVDTLKIFNPKINIILTVSPVKYLRDGLIENNLSKAVLIYSVHEIMKHHSFISYFPAYEIVTDDLRDYRFYKEDLAHPNHLAIEYVWQEFVSSYFSDTAKITLDKINEINKAVAHRPIHKNTEAHLHFKKTYLEKCLILEKDCPGINLEEEKNRLQTNH